MLGAGWGKLPIISRFCSRTGDWLRRSRLNDGSRMSGDVHVWFCEGLGVKFPRATYHVDCDVKLRLQKPLTVV